MISPFNQLGQDMHNLHPSYTFSTSEVSDEYRLLNDFVSSSLMDDSLFGNDGPNVPPMATDPILSNQLNPMNSNNSLLPQANQQGQMLPPSAAIGKSISRPASGFPIDKETRESYLLTAADPAGSESAESRLSKLLKAKYDAGLLRPYNYVKGYGRMGEYMEKNLQPESRSKILRGLSKFRPLFRERAHLLTDYELTMVEIEFDKKLMSYERVFASMAVPACCWRRTGEIYRANKAMAELISAPMEKLRDVRCQRLSRVGSHDGAGQNRDPRALHGNEPGGVLEAVWHNRLQLPGQPSHLHHSRSAQSQHRGQEA
jgi:hypothetical protein